MDKGGSRSGCGGDRWRCEVHIAETKPSLGHLLSVLLYRRPLTHCYPLNIYDMLHVHFLSCCKDQQLVRLATQEFGGFFCRGSDAECFQVQLWYTLKLTRRRPNQTASIQLSFYNTILYSMKASVYILYYIKQKVTNKLAYWIAKASKSGSSTNPSIWSVSSSWQEVECVF